MVGREILSADGRVVLDEGGRAIFRKIQDMLLLVGAEVHGPGGIPQLYVDPTNGTYWEFAEYEDGQITLHRVSRQYIETNWPSVDFDRPVFVPRPIRH